MEQFKARDRVLVISPFIDRDDEVTGLITDIAEIYGVKDWHHVRYHHGIVFNHLAKELSLISRRQKQSTGGHEE